MGFYYALMAVIRKGLEGVKADGRQVVEVSRTGLVKSLPFDLFTPTVYDSLTCMQYLVEPVQTNPPCEEERAKAKQEVEFVVSTPRRHHNV